eukprot:g26773.t1
MYLTSDDELMCGYGDKDQSDVYQLAFRLLHVPFRMMADRPALLVEGKRYAGLIQLDANRSFFAHVSAAKHEMWSLLEAGTLQRCDVSEASNLSCSSRKGHGSLFIAFDQLQCEPLRVPAELLRAIQKLQKSRGRGKKRKSTGGRSIAGSTAKAPAPTPPTTLSQAQAKHIHDPCAPHSLSSNIQGLRFMQSARENEERKKLENEKLRHLEDMQWETPPTKSTPALGVVRLYRRSYKGYNAMVEQSMKDLLSHHADDAAQAEEVDQAKTLRKMKKQRMTKS